MRISLKDPKNITAIAVIAAIYVALTVTLAPFGYGMVQCRIAEVLCLLAFIHPAYGYGAVLGCFIANFASPFGMVDVLAGTFATFLSVVFITKTKNMFIATLWPTLCCAIVAAVVSYYTNTPYLITCLSIMAGEFIVVTIIGYPLLRYICANKRLYSFLSMRLPEKTIL